MSQPSSFRTFYPGFLLSEERRVNWRNIESTDVSRILSVFVTQGDLRDLNNCLDELAYVDLEKDPYISTSKDAHKLIKTMQVGIQYLLYTQGILKHNLTKMNDSVQAEKHYVEKLNQAAQHKKRKIRKLEKEIERLDQRAHHYDMMSDFLRPNLDRPLDFKKQEERKTLSVPKRPKDLYDHQRPSAASQDWLDSADFELSGSYVDKTPPQNTGPKIKVIAEEEQARFRFNSPGTGIEEMYQSPQRPQQGTEHQFGFQDAEEPMTVSESGPSLLRLEEPEEGQVIRPWEPTTVE